MLLSDLRRQYHVRVCSEIIRISSKKKKTTQHHLTSETTITYPNFADGNNLSSIKFAFGILHRLGCEGSQGIIKEQTVGILFEQATKAFLEAAFAELHHLRPGDWIYEINSRISDFDQYEHLARLESMIEGNEDLQSALGGDYIVKPDIVIARLPVSDEVINQNDTFVTTGEGIAQLSPFRKVNSRHPILHASISCKWTIRSDRSQNTRTEALNLIRNRKGHSPHIVAVTAEPLPTRLAALALGTGDLDCVYHFALPELVATIEEHANVDQLDMLNTLIKGRRLRDISDLPLDLAV